jgi:phytoene synthase
VLEARSLTATAAVSPAFEHVRRVARESGSSFYAGMRLLPPDKRDALFAIYALARRIDDIADGGLPADEKLARLARTRDDLARIDSGVGSTEPPGSGGAGSAGAGSGKSTDPVFVAVAEAARRYPIPLDAFGELVEGGEMDVRGTEYVAFAELEHYCRCVAGSIGRLALGVFDCSDRAAGAPLADDLGLALQVGNILRDLAEDVPAGRVYLPREDLERFGCSVGDGRIDGPVELVIAFEAQRALERLDRGLALVPLLDRRSASCVLAMTGKYGRLLERIAGDPLVVMRGRLSLRGWEKGLVLARSLVGGLT